MHAFTTISATLAIFTALACASGDFSQSCPGNYLSYYVLYTNCNQGPGPQGFGLDSVVGNVNGNLVWNSGGYSRSCNECNIVNNNLLVCDKCTNDRGDRGRTVLNLDDCLANFGGHIAYVC